MLTVNVYINVIYDVITVVYCKCILLYSPLNSYFYVHWILDIALIYHFYASNKLTYIKSASSIYLHFINFLHIMIYNTHSYNNIK